MRVLDARHGGPANPRPGQPLPAHPRPEAVHPRGPEGGRALWPRPHHLLHRPRHPPARQAQCGAAPAHNCGGAFADTLEVVTASRTVNAVQIVSPHSGQMPVFWGDSWTGFFTETPADSNGVIVYYVDCANFACVGNFCIELFSFFCIFSLCFIFFNWDPLASRTPLFQCHMERSIASGRRTGFGPSVSSAISRCFVNLSSVA